tara:strand:+ start:49 stop:849 length:801 start_codon:yes stop_codon:yes gene_type:complete
MKISRNSLKELIRQSIDELKEGGPGSGRPKGDDEPFDSGGPSYANVPKGAKTSKQAKEMSKKKKEKKEESVKEYYLKEDGKTCWKGYEQIGMKDKGGKQVPNCVPIKESNGRRTTVKEVRMWMKKLEENRYKKTYNSDCRRVSWMVNHMGEGIENMPVSMSKKWTKAQYGREKYLAKEFIKSKSEQMTEGKVRQFIKETIKDLMEANPSIVINLKDLDKVKKLIKPKSNQFVKLPFSKKEFGLKIDKNKYNKVIELLIKHKIDIRG